MEIATCVWCSLALISFARHVVRMRSATQLAVAEEAVTVYLSSSRSRNMLRISSVLLCGINIVAALTIWIGILHTDLTAFVALTVIASDLGLLCRVLRGVYDIQSSLNHFNACACATLAILGLVGLAI